MKHNNKFQFLVLILTAFIFCGQEYIHPFFHSCGDSASGFIKNSQVRFSAHDQTQSDDHYLSDSEHSCPICASFANKSQKPESIEDKLLSLDVETFPFEPIAFERRSFLTSQPRAPPVF